MSTIKLGRRFAELTKYNDMTNRASGKRRYMLVLLAVLIAVVGIPLVGYVWFDREYNPSRAEAEAITEGMTKDEVKDLLGVLYDQ